MEKWSGGCKVIRVTHNFTLPSHSSSINQMTITSTLSTSQNKREEIHMTWPMMIQPSSRGETMISVWWPHQWMTQSTGMWEEWQQQRESGVIEHQENIWIVNETVVSKCNHQGHGSRISYCDRWKLMFKYLWSTNPQLLQRANNYQRQLYLGRSKWGRNHMK